jgi:hypothetical protein
MLASWQKPKPGHTRREADPLYPLMAVRDQLIRRCEPDASQQTVGAEELAAGRVFGAARFPPGHIFDLSASASGEIDLISFGQHEP